MLLLDLTRLEGFQIKHFRAIEYDWLRSSFKSGHPALTYTHWLHSSSAWASPTVGMMPGLREEMDGGEYVKINALDI